MSEPRKKPSVPLRERTWLFVVAIALVHLLLAWPDVGRRGVIAEEIQPYLRHYPKVLDDRRDPIDYLPPNDDPALRAAIEEGRDVEPRWVGTLQWPEVSYHARSRVVPVFVRGHQTAIGTLFGVALAPLLGGGPTGVRRSSVLMGMALVIAAFGLARRVGLSRGFAALAAVGCAASPGLWFFCRTGYAYELASRLFMLVTLFLAAAPAPPSRWKNITIGLTFAVALLCRATIAATLAPALILMLFHPRRWQGKWRPLGAIALGGGIPIVLVGIALIALPFAAGAAPGADLPIAKLAGRTLVAPAFAAHELAWVVDPRVVLQRLVEGELRADIGLVRPLLGGAVAALAVVRWWRSRAGEAERIFIASLIGNALVGAWLYGDPVKFQLGLALEPLFVLALAQQLNELYEKRARAGFAIGAALLGLRLFTFGSLWSSERRTDNPMLSGRAQRGLVEHVQNERIGGDDLITTAYDHVGVLESLTDEAVRPVHAWRLLRSAGAPEAHVIAQWNRILDARPACFVLLTKAPNMVAGSFTDDRAVERALEKALEARGERVERRRVIEGDGGGPVFEVLELARPSRCGRSGGPQR